MCWLFYYLQCSQRVFYESLPKSQIYFIFAPATSVGIKTTEKQQIYLDSCLGHFRALSCPWLPLLKFPSRCIRWKREYPLHRWGRSGQRGVRSSATFHNHLPKWATGSLSQFQESTSVIFPTCWADSVPSQLKSLHGTPTSSSGPTATHTSQRFLQYFSPAQSLSAKASDTQESPRLSLSAASPVIGNRVPFLPLHGTHPALAPLHTQYTSSISPTSYFCFPVSSLCFPSV